MEISRNISTTNNENNKEYIGSTECNFKKRYYNHISSFKNEKYRTKLFKYVQSIQQEQRINLILKWEILKQCRKYKAGNKFYILCMEEELAIATSTNLTFY